MAPTHALAVPLPSLRTTGVSSTPFPFRPGVDHLDVAQRVRLTEFRSLRAIEDDVRDNLRTVGFGADPESRSRQHRTRGLAFTGFKATVYPIGPREVEVVYHLDDEYLFRRPREVYRRVEAVNAAVLAHLFATEAPCLQVVGLTVYLDFGGVALQREDEDSFFRKGSGESGAWTVRGRRRGKKFTGFDFGRWGRVYLKSEEIRANPSKAYMRDAYGEYDGEVWRVEVKFRRAALRRIKTLDLGALVLGRLGIVTLRAPLAPGARTRSDRRPLDPLWRLAREVAQAGIPPPWEVPPSLPGAWPHSEAARRTLGDRLLLAGLRCHLDTDPLPVEGFTPEMLPALAERHVRALIERDAARAAALLLRAAERHRLLNGDGGA